MLEPSAIPRVQRRVLPTLNPDGSRRWLRPRTFQGRFWRARRALACGLMALFVALPFMRVGGRPALLLDVPAREFNFFGSRLHATDGVLLMLLLLVVCVSIFSITAWIGRAWCGWACPQTIYMEFLFRPLERWLEGGLAAQKRLDREGGGGRRILKYAVFALLSLALANVFLAYFVGVPRLARWLQSSPLAHPAGFAVVAVTGVLIFADFAFFREQMCTLACPYARLQSVLIDPSSLVVGYDARRGEPRGRGPGTGDCVDCKACVVTCPTGIDIRDGLQLECIACAQCADACDSVMLKFGRAPGLIRYGAAGQVCGSAAATQASTLPPRLRRGAYAVLLAALLGALVVFGRGARQPEITLLRGIGAPFEVLGGRVRNQIRIKVDNRSGLAESYQIELSGAPGAELLAPENPLLVAPGARATTSVFVTLPASAFERGVRAVELRLRDQRGATYQRRYQLLGPERSRP